jgi:Raf kinase inhibitor-like YbhB/YbcL family protein
MESVMDPFAVKSPAFKDGSFIPEEYTSHGENMSPPLRFKNLPPGTQELVLLCEDPDAPKPPFFHWVAYGLSPHQSELHPGIPEGDFIRGPQVNMSQGVNSAGVVGYMGPKPPQNTGVHRYYFRVYALDQKLNLPPGLSVDEVLNAVKGHVIAETWTMGKHRYH